MVNIKHQFQKLDDKLIFFYIADFIATLTLKGYSSRHDVRYITKFSDTK